MEMHQPCCDHNMPIKMKSSLCRKEKMKTPGTLMRLWSPWGLLKLSLSGLCYMNNSFLSYAAKHSLDWYTIPITKTSQCLLLYFCSILRHLLLLIFPPLEFIFTSDFCVTTPSYFFPSTFMWLLLSLHSGYLLFWPSIGGWHFPFFL